MLFEELDSATFHLCHIEIELNLGHSNANYKKKYVDTSQLNASAVIYRNLDIKSDQFKLLLLFNGVIVH